MVYLKNVIFPISDYLLTYLTRYFYTNILDMEESIARTGLSGEKVVVFLSTSSKDITDYLIGSTSEIMAYGMPYARSAGHD